MYINRYTVEFATVGVTKSGSIYHHLWSNAEIDGLLKEHDLSKAADTGDSMKPPTGSTAEEDESGRT